MGKYEANKRNTRRHMERHGSTRNRAKTWQTQWKTREQIHFSTGNIDVHNKLYSMCGAMILNNTLY